jgi:hypothetical protein
MSKVKWHLPGERFMYYGEDNESFTNGKYYRVVNVGNHWFKKLGKVVWFTNNNYDGDDEDYCTSVSLSYLNKYFYK